jgi:large repetitive protein
MPNLLPNTLEVQIVRMVKALYDAAPGYTFLTAFKSLGTVEAVSQSLNSNFASLTNTQWAALIATNLHLTGNAATAAQNYLVAQINAGFTRAQVLPAAMTGLAGLEADGTFGAAALYFNNSITTSYSYSINPANTSTDIAGVLRLADEPNSPPVAVNDTGSATEGGSTIGGSVALNDTDAEGNTLTYSLAAGQNPVAGLVFNTNGSYTFDPRDPAYDNIAAGATRAVAVNYRVSDGQGGSAGATLTITVTGTNDAPVASAVTATGNEDTVISVTPSSTDVDAGDTATYSVVSNPTRGTVAFNAVTGRFDYTPAANFNGIDSFTYRVTDAGGLSSAPVTATVNVSPTNDAPVAVAGQPFSGPEGSNITGTVTGTDIDGDTLTYSVPAAGATGAPANGTVSINAATGAFVYTPKAGYVGSDTFTFTANDGKGGVSAPGTVTVNVTDLPDILTTAIDSVVLSGSVAQTVLGNELTYNSGDSIVGGSGVDTLRLQINPAGNGTTTLSSASVSGIEVFQISSNPNNPSAATVDLLMTNVSTDLTSIEISKSTVQNLIVRDIQGAPGVLPTVKINDVGANVTIDVDNQDVLGSADQLNIELNEFGSNSSSALGRASLSVDGGIETVQITDKATSNDFGSDIRFLNGGYKNVNILAGTTGVDLIISGAGGFNSNASTVTVNSTTFLGDLVADVDGADTVLAGVGDDELTADDQVNGLLDTGAGNDMVFVGEDLDGTVLGGSGNDTVNVQGSMNDFVVITGGVVTNDGKSLIDGGSGNDSISVNGIVNSLATITSGTGDDSVFVGGNLAGTVTGDDGNDSISIGSTTVAPGVATTGLVDGGAGNDTIKTWGLVTGTVLGGSGDDTITSVGVLGDNTVVTSPAVRGTIDGGDGNDTISQTGTVSEGSVINGGAGDDTITVAGNIEGNLVDNLTPAVNDYQAAAAINGGDGNDKLTISSGTFNGKVNMGTGNDAVTIKSAVVDGTGAVDLGEGDDTITLENRNWTAATTDGALGNDDAIMGGAGNDAMTLVSTSTRSTTAQTVTVGYSLSSNGTIRATFNDGASATQPAPVAVTVNNASSLAATVTALAAALNANATISAYWVASVNTSNQLVLTSVANGSSAPLVSFTNGESIAQSGAITNTSTGTSVFGGNGGAVGPWSITSDGTGTVITGDVNDATDITGVETLNLNAIDGYVGDEVGNTAGVQDLKYAHTFNVALEAYDSALATINVLERDNNATVNLTGYASEQINVDSDGNQNSAATSAVVINVNDNQTGAARALNIALNGTSAYGTTINDPQNLLNVINLAVNGTGARTVVLDGVDQDNNDTVAGEGNTLNISGNSTAALTITGISQETINGGGYAGNQLLTIVNDGEADETMTITTGGGNDVINMVGDRLSYSINVATGVASGDSINGGAGTDRLIIANSTTTSGNSIDQDFVFKRITSVEELEVRGNDGGTLNVSIENDANLTGIRKIIASNNAGTRGNVNLNFESDFAIGGTPPAVVVDVESSNIVIDNGANSNMMLNIQAAKASAGGTASGALVNFVAQSGTGSGVVDVNVIINGTGTTWVGGVNDPILGPVVNTGAGTSTGIFSGVAGVVDLRTTIGTIDSLTLTDNGTTDNAVNVTWNDAWANGVASFNVTMALADNDTSVGSSSITTGGVNFVGAAEDDTAFNIVASANNDTIWGGQLGDTIVAGGGNDLVNADPAIGQVVAPGQQLLKSLTFDLTQQIEAGDRVSVTVGGRTYTWTAPAVADGSTLGASGALTALRDAINNAAPTANVTETGNIDDSNNEDDVTAYFGSAVAGNDSLSIQGTGVDATFGFSLGENPGYNSTLTAVTMNRPTAVVTVPTEPYDVNDVVTINVNGTPYSATVGELITVIPFNVADTASELATLLAARVTAGGVMTAEANGAQVILRGNTASTAYTLNSSWTVDAVTTPAASKTVAIAYTAPAGGDSVSVTFTGGITVSSTSVAGLAAAINANGTLAPQWNATATGNNLALSTDVAGAAAPTNDFNSANFNGSGTASWSTTAGTNAVVRTDNTDPSTAARTATFTFADSSYDAGDVIVVTINGVTTNVTLGSGADATNDVNLTGAQVAAQVSTAVAAAGVADVAVGNTVRFDAGAGGIATFSVTTTDITRTGPSGATPGDVAEVVTVDYSAVVAGATGFSITINGTTLTNASLAGLTAAINASGVLSGADGFDAALVGNVITLTGPSNGTEPYGIAEAADAVITGAATSSGGTTSIATVAPVLAIPRVETVDFSGVTGTADGASMVVNGTTYAVLPGASNTATIAALAAAINTGEALTAANLKWMAQQVGTNLVLTGPADGSNPVNLGVANVRDEAAFNTIGAATAADPTNGEIYTITLTPTPSTPGITSISVSFDTDGLAGPTVGDTVLVGSSTANLAALINSNPGGALNGLTAVATGLNTLQITGPASGIGSTTPPVQVNVTGDGTGAVATTSPADPTANTWTQTYALNEIGAGETTIVRFSNGSTISVPFTTDEATTLANIGAAIENVLFPTTVGTVTATAAANTIQIDGPNFTLNPSVTVVQIFTYVNTAATSAVTTAGAPPTRQVVTIDFTNWDASNELGSVTFENGETFSAPWAGSLAASLAALKALIDADTATNGDVQTTTSWATTAVAGNTLVLTGPLSGAPSQIGYTSSAITASGNATVLESFESWDNTDNNNPGLTVTSGAANIAPTFVFGQSPGVAAIVATANGSDSVSGGDGNDTINGFGGNDTISGDAGNDSIDGGIGNDVLSGGTGNDTVFGGNDNDSLSGGDGNDLLDAGAGNDTVEGGDGADRLLGGDGNDVIMGGAGDDFIRGGTGRDVLTGGDGTDVFYFSAITSLSESQGAVSFADVVTDFASGTDKFQFDFTVNFYANVTNATNLIAGLTDVSAAAGPAAGRAIYDSSAKVLFVDVNGDGAITVSDDIVIDLTQSNVAALSKSDFISPDGNATITGTTGNDLLIGNGSSQTLLGLDGNDTLFGANGVDTLTGGNGSDVFQFASTGDSTNTITDFASGTDKLQFTATTVAFAGNVTALGTSLSTAPAAGKAVLVVTTAGSVTTGVLNVDVDGDGFADITLTLAGVASLTQGDFLAPTPAPGL